VRGFQGPLHNRARLNFRSTACCTRRRTGLNGAAATGVDAATEAEDENVSR
jgi:hypothetical protein